MSHKPPVTPSLGQSIAFARRRSTLVSPTAVVLHPSRMSSIFLYRKHSIWLTRGMRVSLLLSSLSILAAACLYAAERCVHRLAVREDSSPYPTRRCIRHKTKRLTFQSPASLLTLPSFRQCGWNPDWETLVT